VFIYSWALGDEAQSQEERLHVFALVGKPKTTSNHDPQSYTYTHIHPGELKRYLYKDNERLFVILDLDLGQFGIGL